MSIPTVKMNYWHNTLLHGIIEKYLYFRINEYGI